MASPVLTRTAIRADPSASQGFLFPLCRSLIGGANCVSSRQEPGQVMPSGRGAGELHESEIPSVAWIDQDGMLDPPLTQTETVVKMWQWRQ